LAYNFKNSQYDWNNPLGNPHYFHRHLRVSRLPDGILYNLALRCRFYVAMQRNNQSNQEKTIRKEAAALPK